MPTANICESCDHAPAALAPKGANGPSLCLSCAHSEAICTYCGGWGTRSLRCRCDEEAERYAEEQRGLSALAEDLALDAAIEAAE